MLGEIYNSCYETANSLKNWQKLNKNQIANLYLDNRNTEMGNIYGAALLCKYWYKVGLIWKNNKKSMSQEDCYAIVWDGIERAMDYAPWRNPTNKLYQDPNGPDKAINVCIDSIRKIQYTFSNRDKRKANYGGNTVSADMFAEEYNDFIGDLNYDIEAQDDKDTFHIYILIGNFVKHNRLPEAIIVDNICFNDSAIKTADGCISFNERKLLMAIHTLDTDDYVNYFFNQYGVDKEEVRACLKGINNLSYNLLHKLIDRTLYMIKNLDRYKYVY